MANGTSNQEDSENFWKVEADDSAFWDAYVSTRPNYSPSFYGLMYAHHAAHSSSFAVAHDVGCGAGQVAAELTSRFAHVVASDNNDTHLTVARRRLAASGNSRVSYTLSKGEDLASKHPSSSVDMIAAAECMVLMDSDEGLASFAKLLKPGGTLATWFYGRPTFSEPAYAAKCQPLLDEIMVRNWRKVIQGSGPARQSGFKRAADGMASWLDYVQFSPEIWTDVKRIKWNPQGTLPFFGKEACGFDVQAVSNIGKGENVVSQEDLEFWKNNWDAAGVKKYMSVLFPGFKEAIGDGDADIDRLFEELTEAMGTEGEVRQFTWPCVLVLATRR
ncbi:hypothetical protein MMC20_005866 [Loxospora ochrophaea]|nr:hypothetical protein [Loxospora ochrophaea]